MPKVSVIIPNYNHARYLPKRIDSVLDQTFQDFEIILLDDASTDNSREVLASYASDSRVRCIFNETNSGSVFKQWNKGFREARSEYVWIAESDDYADHCFLEKLVGKLDQHPEVGVAYCQSWVVDENDKKLQIVEHNRKHIEENRWKSDFVNRGSDECTRYFILGCMINNASSALVRKAVVEQIGYADEDWKVTGDWVFWAKMLLASDIAFIAEPHNYWRQHSGTVRSSTTKNGIIIAESYRVSSYIAEQANIGEDTMEKARSMRFRSWICNNEELPLSLSQHRAIYHAAKEFDPNINRRLLFYSPWAPFRTIAKQARKLIHKRAT